MASSNRPFRPRFHDIPIAGILAAPLLAAVCANSAMAKEQIKFLLEFCFAKSNEDKVSRPVMVDMMLTKTEVEPGDDGPVIKSVTTVFSIPLLTLIPISTLAIESVDLSYGLSISQQRQRNSSSTANAPQGSSPRQPNDHVELIGRLGSRRRIRKSKYQKSRESEFSMDMEVDVKARQLPLPEGIKAILDLYLKNVAPKEVSDQQSGSTEG